MLWTGTAAFESFGLNGILISMVRPTSRLSGCPYDDIEIQSLCRMVHGNINPTPLHLVLAVARMGKDQVGQQVDHGVPDCGKFMVG